MICYKDMTFCDFWKDCKNGETCNRALTDDVREKAKEWTQDIFKDSKNDPVSLICIFTDKPKCFLDI